MKGKALLCLALVTSMLFGVFTTSPVSAQSTTIGVEPDSIVDPGLGPGSTFTVDIWVRDVANLAGLEFKLGYDTAVLTATLIEYGDIFGATYYPGPSVINDAEGWLGYAVIEAFGEPGFYGDGRAAIIHFTVDSVGVSILYLYDTILGDASAPPNSIVHDALDGYFTNMISPPPHYFLTISTTTGGTTDPSPGTYPYDEGTVVSVTAIPDAGYLFDHWELEGVNVGDVNPIDVTMDTNHALKAVFTHIPVAQYDLTIVVVGSGTTSPVQGVHTYNEDTTVRVDAIPDAGWMLDHWELDGVNVGVADPYGVTMDADHTLKAVFSPAPLTTIGVEPDSIVDPGLGPGSTFTVDIWVRDVANLAGLSFKLAYDTTVLTATLIEYGDIFGDTYVLLFDMIYDADGYLQYDVMEVFGEPGFYGDGRVAIIHFTVDSVGDSALDLYETKLGDLASPPNVIAHDALDGYFSNVSSPVQEALEELIETIETWNLPKGTENSLTSKLEGAIHLLDRGNENGATHKLMNFINQVEAFRRKKLTDEQADYLTSEAQRIINLIEG